MFLMHSKVFYGFLCFLKCSKDQLLLCFAMVLLCFAMFVRSFAKDKRPFWIVKQLFVVVERLFAIAVRTSAMVKCTFGALRILGLVRMILQMEK